MKLFTIRHRSFQTDRMGSCTTEVYANSKEEAVEKFNTFIDNNKNKKLWCYYDWNKVTVKDVYVHKTLDDIKIK